VIAVFTKYNQFKIDIEDHDHDAKAQVHVEIDHDHVFNEQYLARLKGTPLYIRLESEVSAIVETHTELISLAQKPTKPAQSVMLSSN
jgi:hypothetical protein